MQQTYVVYSRLIRDEAEMVTDRSLMDTSSAIFMPFHVLLSEDTSLMLAVTGLFLATSGSLTSTVGVEVVSTPPQCRHLYKLAVGCTRQCTVEQAFPISALQRKYKTTRMIDPHIRGLGCCFRKERNDQPLEYI